MKTSIYRALPFFLAVCMSHLVLADEGRIEYSKLLTAEIGWAASEQKIFWTTDAGQHWQDISPPKNAGENITSVFFLDPTTGWALLSKASDPEPVFRIAVTTTSGRIWNVNSVTI